MAAVHATWTQDGALFFWSHEGDVEPGDLARFEAEEAGIAVDRTLVQPGARPRRKRVSGWLCPVGALLPTLSSLSADDPISDSVRVWGRASLLAMELAAHQRVVPTVVDGDARWRALLGRPSDLERFRTLAACLPPVARATPTQPRGAIRLRTAEAVVRAFLDEAVDSLYRQNARPGSAKGWVFDIAQALRGEARAFAPRQARYQGIAEKLAAWSADAQVSRLRPAFSLELPRGAGETFRLSILVHPGDRPDLAVPVGTAWRAGAGLHLDEHTWPHPAHDTLLGLARAARLFPPLELVLSGDRPLDLEWGPGDAWGFLDRGAPALSAAGFEVWLPREFAEAGTRRIRARMRIGTAETEDGGLDLDGLLDFSWEVVLGDSVLTGGELSDLLARREPLVRFRGAWVLLDPAELERLPAELTDAGRLPAPEALRAVLTGEYQGVPVVADDRLSLLLEALRRPPPMEIPRGFSGELRPYQREGFAWLATLGRLGLGACLADDMGLGKTVQLIVHVLARREAGRRTPTLVVCPTSVLGNWMRELDRFAPGLRAVRYHGFDRDEDDLGYADVVLTTYGLLVRDQDLLCDLDWDVAVLDEAQSIKNPDSRRARAARRLSARHRVALTGTPVENRLDELWSLMEFLVPSLLGPRARFRREVAVPVERFGDEEVARRLKLGVAPFLLRRLKTDPLIVPDLPDKLESRELCPLTREQAILYEDVVEDHMERIASSADVERRGHVLAMLTALKQVCNHPAHYLGEPGPLEGRSGKLERTADLLDAILDAGESALVFTQYRAMGELLRTWISDFFDEEVPFLHGGVPPHGRDEMVRAFQSGGGPPVLLVSLRAGGTGLNLTAATHVIHYDRWWNPAVEDQATDRAYRIGQHKDVQVHKLVVQDSLEERIDQMLEDKRALADSVVGRGERWVTELTDDELKRLVFLGADAVVEEL